MHALYDKAQDSLCSSMLSHRFISGNPTTCLEGPNNIVLTESTAKRYFGEDDPANKALQIDGVLFNVTAVIADVRENSHLKFDIVLPQLPDRPWFRGEGGQTKSVPARRPLRSPSLGNPFSFPSRRSS